MPSYSVKDFFFIANFVLLHYPHVHWGASNGVKRDAFSRMDPTAQFP